MRRDGLTDLVPCQRVNQDAEKDRSGLGFFFDHKTYLSDPWFRTRYENREEKVSEGAQIS